MAEHEYPEKGDDRHEGHAHGDGEGQMHHGNIEYEAHFPRAWHWINVLVDNGINGFSPVFPQHEYGYEQHRLNGDGYVGPQVVAPPPSRISPPPGFDRSDYVATESRFNDDRHPPGSKKRKPRRRPRSPIQQPQVYYPGMYDDPNEHYCAKYLTGNGGGLSRTNSAGSSSGQSSLRGEAPVYVPEADRDPAFNYDWPTQRYTRDNPRGL